MKPFLRLNRKQHTASGWLRFSLALVLIILCAAVNAGQAYSSTDIVVNSFNDAEKSNDGVCTLREAIIAANTDRSSGSKVGECAAGSGADTIILPPGTHVLSRSDSGNEDACVTGDLDIVGDLTIVGGAGVVIDAAGITGRAFDVLSGRVVMSAVTIKNGGRGVEYGGGIYNRGTLTLMDCALVDNVAEAGGGGAYNAPSGVLGIVNSTVSGNAVTGEGVDGGLGGGILNRGTLTLSSSTVSGNRVAAGAAEGGQGGGIANDGGTAESSGSIIAGNVAGSALDCWGPVTSMGYNLLQSTLGCNIGGDTTGNILGLDPVLGPLQDNGGGTLTHALSPLSPAVEAGSPGCLPPATDQRGVSRPRGVACDIGSYELQDPPQSGSFIQVNTSSDTDDGLCDINDCSLREAIDLVNARPNRGANDAIHFNIPDVPPVIQLGSALPDITDPVTVDGTTQPGGSVVLDGGGIGAQAVGLRILSGASLVRGLHIVGFPSHGVVLAGGDGNTIDGDTIAYNGGDGIRILSDSTGNALIGNDIHDNAGLQVDLGGDGPTPNDRDDPDSGANYLQNYPVLMRAVPSDSGIDILARLNSAANTEFTVEFFSTAACGAGETGGLTPLGSDAVTTDGSGNVYFRTAVAPTVPEGRFVLATATDPGGNTSEFSPCASVGPGNDSWPRAYSLDPLAPSASYEQYIDMPGQSRWYKFSIEPNSELIVTLTSLPANYDLSVYKDIAEAFLALQAPTSTSEDLLHLGAEFAPGSFSPGSFSPGSFSPGSFSPDIFAPGSFSPGSFSPGSFSPGSFSPDIYAPGSFSPGSFSPGSFSPGSFSPGSFSPDVFAPGSFSPGSFSPGSFSPGSFSPGSFSGAQTRSLVGFSAFDGTAGEGIMLNTWNNTGEFYVRVSGRNGAFSQEAPFHLAVMLLAGQCGDISADSLPASDLSASAGGYKTVVLTDLDRMMGTDSEKGILQTKLSEFIGRPEVQGVIVDVGDDARVEAANQQADANYECPYAKNLVADAIKDIVDGYRELNPTEYVVIVGNDDTIPFFRYPDNALMGHESNYVPPVLDHTASQASLRLGYVLSQDGYGTQTSVSAGANDLPFPELPVGRLVETPQDIISVIDAYLGTAGGIVAPTSGLVSGYDFLTDAALAVQAELEAGLGAPVDALISPADLAPLDPASWSADDLGALLLGERHDVAFLAGHFSANSALAADFTTNLLTTDLVGSDVDLANAIIFSAGCHSGYNIVNQHGIPGITFEPDWAQAFAQKGATLIAGTGYQYGDTEYIEYSERLYLEFARQLRAAEGPDGNAPVSIGRALVAAKQDYLATTAVLRGIHEKSLLEATIFGLPMLSVDMPGDRLEPDADDPAVTPPLGTFGADPGAELGLQYADLTLALTPDLRSIDLDAVDEYGQLVGQVTAHWVDGSDGIQVNPTEPVLPRELVNVAVPDTVLRGVGFRSGSYVDMEDLVALTGAAATDIRGVHVPFFSPVFYPIRFWGTNFFDALADPLGGITQLVVTPAQFKTSQLEPDRGTIRIFNELGFRLYYSGNTGTYGEDSTPALADAPAIVSVSASHDADTVSFGTRVVGNPATGIQEVWVSYTELSNPGTWESIDLVQSDEDSTLWHSAGPDSTLALPPGTSACDIRYVVQAVNGVGLVTLESNLGEFFDPCATEPTEATALQLELLSGDTASYGSVAHFKATLTRTSDGAGVPGQFVVFGLGPQARIATTNSSGQAELDMPILVLPDPDNPYGVRAAFFGGSEYQPSFDSASLSVRKASTSLVLEPESGGGFPSGQSLVVATLRDEFGRPLNEAKTVFFVVADGPTFPVVTDPTGRAVLGEVSLPPGTYQVTGYFNGEIPGPDGTVITTLDDPRYEPCVSSVVTLEILNCPQQHPISLAIWPQDRELHGVQLPGLLGVTDPDGDAVSVQVVSIFQDEPVGSNTFSPDGQGIGTDTALLRAERDGNGDGRVYHVFFTASGGQAGGLCSGELLVGIVPHDQGSSIFAIDGGALYDSTVPD